MSILFDDANNEGITVSASPISTLPAAFSCWFNRDALPGAMVLQCVTNASGSQRYMTGISAAGAVFAQQVGVTTDGAAITSTTTSVDTWHHACGLLTSDSSRVAFLDGAGKITDSTSTGASTITEANIGHLVEVNEMSGLMAEMTIWNDLGTQLTDAEVVSLARGSHPFSVRRDKIMSYLPGLRGFLYDFVAGIAWSADTNLPDVGEHPPQVSYPRQRRIVVPPAAAGGRIMSSLARYGGLVGAGGIAGQGGGLAG